MVVHRGPAGLRHQVRRVLAAYRDAPARDRLHVAGRWLSCPFRAVEPEVPPAGRVLDVGCGHGSFALYLALASPTRQVTGTDVDAHKVDLARRAARELGLGNVRFEVVEPGATPTGEWEAVTLVDVLYLLGRDRARRLLAEAAASLATGGAVVVKEMDVRPTWKRELNRAQELVATRVARITQGDHVEVVPPAVMADELTRRGLTVTRQRLDRRSLHPHHLVVGRHQPAGPGPRSHTRAGDGQPKNVLATS